MTVSMLKPATMRDMFAITATQLLDEDPRTVIVLADISAALFTEAAARHPDRVVNVGIREQLLVGVAGGLALEGFRPIVHTFASFLVERPFEQIKLALAHQGAGAVLVSAGASYDVSAGGRTHQSPGDVALLDTLPDVRIHVPGHPEEADRLIRDAVAADGIHYVRLSTASNREPREVTSTWSAIRSGRRGTVVAVGPMLDRVLAATADLDVTVLYAATVRPFDHHTLRATLTAPQVAMVEPYLAGTSAREVAAALTDVPHRQIGLGVARRELRRYGTPAEHDAAHGLDIAGLRTSLTEFFRDSSGQESTR